MGEYYPLQPVLQDLSKEKANPMLYLPHTRQLVGAVFIESNQSETIDRPKDITPSVDREGYIQNEAYNEMVEIVRTGMELIAFVDHAENRRLEKEKAKKAAKELRSDFHSAIDHIKNIPSLTDDDRDRLTVQYTELSKQLENVEDYYQDVNQRMDTMALLGVLAGFMTHEMKRLLSEMEHVVNHLKKISGKDKYVTQHLPGIISVFDEVKGQMDYSALYISSLQNREIKHKPIPVAAQIDLVVERFINLSKERGIETDVDADDNLEGPALPVTLYSGILLNLYTNALKAVLARSTGVKERRIAIKAWNERKWHIIEMIDNGVGIPIHLRKRIWDPLFTTTSGGSSNPLGSGMGLGLSLLRDVILRHKGRIGLIDPPSGYMTCFRVELPIVRS